MKRELSLDQALERAKVMPYAYFSRLSAVEIGPAPKEPDLAEIIQARFFGPDGEVRIFPEDGELKAVEFSENEKDVYIEETRCTRREQFGRAVKVRRHVEFDQDGQARIVATRLLSWEG